jgi:microcompartment protein CcmK/EutM
MEAVASKEKILGEAGYVYNFERMVYLNRKTKKVLIAEFVEDHNEDCLQECLAQDSNGAGWRFYFNRPPQRP